MRKILLTKGKVALVDDEDYEDLVRFKWYTLPHRRTFYAVREITFNNWKTKRQIRMHSVILPPLANLEPDHIDGNGLNNQRYNLRRCTGQQNRMNQKPQLGTSSKYKGVHWDKQTSNWAAVVKFNQKSIRLGRFKKEKDAALTYNIAAINYFGEFARLNIISTPIDREQLMKRPISLEKGENDGRRTST